MGRGGKRVIEDRVWVGAGAGARVAGKGEGGVEIAGRKRQFHEAMGEGVRCESDVDNVQELEGKDEESKKEESRKNEEEEQEEEEEEGVKVGDEWEEDAEGFWD